MKVTKIDYIVTIAYLTIAYLILSSICALSIISLGNNIQKLFVGMIFFQFIAQTGIIYILFAKIHNE